MKSRSSIPINFLRRAEIKRLVPDLKLLLIVLNVTCDSNVGCWIPADLSADSGLDVTALAGALDELEARKLISQDVITGEIFLRDFFRHNTFGNAKRHAQAAHDLLNVESVKLCKLVIEAARMSPFCELPVNFLDEIYKKHRLNSQEKLSEVKESKGVLEFRQYRKKTGI